MSGTPLEETEWFNFLQEQEGWAKMNSFQDAENRADISSLFDGILV
jgi:hypothetical protein